MTWRMLDVVGTVIGNLPGVEVFERHHGRFVPVDDWEWSDRPHRHYEVAVVPGRGSYWVAASTHPPRFWGREVKRIVGDPRNGVVNPVNPTGTEFRRSATYIWIPLDSEPRHFQETGTTFRDLEPGRLTARIPCHGRERDCSGHRRLGC